MNHATLIGRLTKEPEIYNSVAKFTLAVDRGHKDGQDLGCDFIRCAAFNNTASVVEKYLHKGSRIAIEGRISTGSYEKNGEKVFTTEVAIQGLTFLDTKKKDPEPEASPDSFVILNEEVPF